MFVRYDATRGRVIFVDLSQFELRLETEAQAKDASYAADVFVLGMAKVDRSIGNPEQIAALVLEVRGPDIAKHIVPGPHQSVELKPDGSAIMKIGAKYAAPVPATEAEIKEALRETLRYPIDEPRVKALAQQAIGNATTPREKVARLLRFTRSYIRPKIDAVGPALFDLLDRRAGDCKSYALLFNTLARAVGIPSREVAGLGYMGDDVLAYGGHVWNEVVLDGVWVPVDAQTLHVPMRELHLRGGLADQFTTLPKVTLRVVAVEPRP
jgi:transglutaminase-like putative cysteine protease